MDRAPPAPRPGACATPSPRAARRVPYLGSRARAAPAGRAARACTAAATSCSCPPTPTRRRRRSSAGTAAPRATRSRRASTRAVAALGTSYTTLTIRNQRTRWGSCSSSGAMSFNWRLLLAPEPVLDYVVWHEACHLRVMDHSPRFWALVRAHCPDYEEHRRWLRPRGLHWCSSAGRRRRGQETPILGGVVVLAAIVAASLLVVVLSGAAAATPSTRASSRPASSSRATR